MLVLGPNRTRLIGEVRKNTSLKDGLEPGSDHTTETPPKRSTATFGSARFLPMAIATRSPVLIRTYSMTEASTGPCWKTAKALPRRSAARAWLPPKAVVKPPQRMTWLANKVPSSDLE